MRVNYRRHRRGTRRVRSHYLHWDGFALIVIHDQRLLAFVVWDGAPEPLGFGPTIASQQEQHSNYNKIRRVSESFIRGFNTIWF